METTEARKLIVLADDDQFITRAYKSGLEEAGYMVIVAGDGESAIKEIQALHPDLVVMEMILPKQDGFAVLQALKSDPTVSNIPVLVLTNLTQPSDADEARRLGAADVLVKAEVSLHDVLLHIERLLSAKA